MKLRIKATIENQLTSEEKEKFIALADQQRNLPEQAMLGIQRIAGGGVLPNLVEHAGDIIHRMNEAPTFNSAGYEFVKPKIELCLRRLTHPYGFAKEFEENILSNARCHNENPEELREKIYAALKVYATEQDKLPAYNVAHRTCKRLTHNIGNREWNAATLELYRLDDHLGSVEDWIKYTRQIN